jgi:uncharacterized protein YqgC (DUF456 family)
MYPDILLFSQSIGSSLGALGKTVLHTSVGEVMAQATPAASVVWQPILYSVLLLVMVVGVLGAVIPALPGISLVVGAMVIWGFVVGFGSLKWALGVAIVATVLSVVIDYLAGVLGAQRVGASVWGQVGAFVGMFLGLFGLLPLLPTGIPLLGLLLGTVIGAFIGEFLHRRELKLGQRITQSGKVGLAIVVGTLVGNVLQGILALIAFAVFVVTTWQGVWAML